MIIEIKKEFDFWDLKKMCWSGAIYTINRIEEEGKQEELMQLLNDIFYDDTPTDTLINDFLWFDTEYIYECLGIKEEG